MSLQGTSFIGAARGESTGTAFHAVNPATREPLAPAYYPATAGEIDRAAVLAAEAFPVFSRTSGKDRGAFLRSIAEEIEAVAEEIAGRGPLETGLPEARLRGETARTTGQLRLFANLIEEGSWVDARIDHAQPDRKPLPKVDLRSMLRPLGPVAVFCASNFPLAFSVAGGDTASALAAGCPVIVKAHPSHPALAEIVAGAVRRAVVKAGLPEGVFSLIYDSGYQAGISLVKHPLVKAIGFTGSRTGGLALMDAAASRPEPIPVYAEMSSINPIVLLPGALADRGEALAEGLFASLTLGAGQFCTNPGVVFIAGDSHEAFDAKLKSLIDAAPSSVMLNAGILTAYERATAAADAPVFARAATATGKCAPVAYRCTVGEFMADERLQAEIFGPATLLVTGTADEITGAIASLEGQLTATIHAAEGELSANLPLLAAMENRAGRVIFNGFPTGVEVCPSMVHGGPFPATSDGRSSSVGTMAIFRYCRPVAWQSFPQDGLPAELQDANPLGILRLVNGGTTR